MPKKSKKIKTKTEVPIIPVAKTNISEAVKFSETASFTESNSQKSVKFVCKKYPFLYIYDLDVKFSDGVYETENKNKIEALRKIISSGKLSIEEYN